jgi:LysM repeat protein
VQLPNSPLQCAVPLKKSNVAWTTSAALLAIGLLVAAWQVDGWKHDSRRDAPNQGPEKAAPAPPPLERPTTASPVSQGEARTSPTVVPARALLAQGIAVSKPASTAASNPPQLTFYVVKAGDTLTKIARHHGTTVKALRAVNDFKADRIAIGEKIRIPMASAPQPNGKT